MKTRFIAALLVTFSVSTAAPAFASGYGPAPFYKPSSDASSSQRGQSARDLASASMDAQQAYGGGLSDQSQSGERSTGTARDSLYSHH